MSWMQKLCETYDYAMSVGNTNNVNNPLPPIGFKVEKVTVEVLLSETGEFIDATEIAKDEQQTAVPATPESIVARGAPVKPHPLFDKAKELGSDEQMKLLQNWCESDDAPPEIKVISCYLSKKALIADLQKSFELKGIKAEPEKSCICFRIESSTMSIPYWSTEAFVKSWQRQFDALCSKLVSEICYVTGEKTFATRKHPFASATAMLISMENENCIGRFESNASEALSVGLSTTLKAHNARNWLMKKQSGQYLYGMELLIWDTRAFTEESLIKPDPFETLSPDTGVIEGEALAKAAKGYWNKMFNDLSSDDELLSTIVVMCTEAATKGRLSIVYYQEFSPNDYIDNLMNWYNGCIWHRYDRDKGGNVVFSPWIFDICNLIYGRRNDIRIVKLKKGLSKELIPSITARKPLARSLITAAFNKVINPLSYTNDKGSFDKYAWQNNLSVACALIRKYYCDKGDEHSMQLNEKETNRDYLYGRLLALADTAEQMALMQGESARSTNAMRYMQIFQQRPAQAWLMLRTQKLLPYLEKLNPGARSWFEKQFSTIESMFEVGEFDSPLPLGPRFLEGFSNQKVYKSTNKNNEEE